MPAAGFHHSGVARLSGLARCRARRRAIAISARCSATAASGPGEFLQAGIESFGRTDIAAADAEMLALGLEATAHFGSPAPDIRIGDVGLFAALVSALDLAPAWKRRLIKDFNRKAKLAQDLDRLTLGAAERPARISGRAGGARRLRSESRACAGHRPAFDRRHHRRRRPLGRRDRRPVPGAIGARCFGRAAARTRALIERFLPSPATPTTPPRRCASSRATPSSSSTPALDLFESRAGFLAERGIDVAAHPLLIRLRPRHGLLHRLRVRTARRRADAEPLVAGGRYDGMLTRLGAAADPGGRLLGLDRAACAALRRRRMSAPSRHRGAGQGPPAGECGKLFRARRPAARQAARRARLSRHHRGFDGVEIAYLSAAEITAQLAQGGAHLGVTGEDLVREMIPRRRRARDPARRGSASALPMWWSRCRRPGSTCAAWPISTTSRPRSGCAMTARCGSRPNT